MIKAVTEVVGVATTSEATKVAKDIAKKIVPDAPPGYFVIDQASECPKTKKCKDSALCSHRREVKGRLLLGSSQQDLTLYVEKKGKQDVKDGLVNRAFIYVDSEGKAKKIQCVSKENLGRALFASIVPAIKFMQEFSPGAVLKPSEWKVAAKGLPLPAPLVSKPPILESSKNEKRPVQESSKPTEEPSSKSEKKSTHSSSKSKKRSVEETSSTDKHHHKHKHRKKTDVQTRDAEAAPPTLPSGVDEIPTSTEQLKVDLPTMESIIEQTEVAAEPVISSSETPKEKSMESDSKPVFVENPIPAKKAGIIRRFVSFWLLFGWFSWLVSKIRPAKQASKA